MSITTNHDAARELYLYAANNWETCARSIQPTAANMDRKRARGTFDRERAAVAFASCAEFGARQYARAYGGTWCQLFPPATRREAAKMLLDDYLADVEDNAAAM